MTASVTLALVLVVSTSSPVPILPISALGNLDDGTSARTKGLVAELITWDDGTENLILVDAPSGRTLTVVCEKAACAQPSSYVHTGDEVEVMGQVYGTYSSKRLYTDSDRVTLLQASRFVLTVDSLVGCWRLFEGDSIEIRGILVQGASNGGIALRAFASSSAVALDPTYESDDALLGREVMVSGLVAFDEDSFTVKIIARSIVVDS